MLCKNAPVFKKKAKSPPTPQLASLRSLLASDSAVFFPLFVSPHFSSENTHMIKYLPEIACCEIACCGVMKFNGNPRTLMAIHEPKLLLATIQNIQPVMIINHNVRHSTPGT